ncbi:hypothetical protein ASPZODRAFT_641485 [Penicilliopsis zonata CBS 506.65]|uniref:Uncharacterized protein n=1 Tax=Penicilliopsis zonata CBS 506.65 TaxID=1073090 RepID=A0A1L9SCG5_9EURO|nr:hypothetical protein ASPZODRAFT_641485 [Penicilliopsis zonata CBS 506.65]OJJ44876.1 hypothetical protein ASPZODRAFT_641485 [Penicilliopsis zonata CBS 506.65]
MDTRNLPLVSSKPVSQLSTAVSHLNIASALVAPGSFLFHQRPKPTFPAASRLPAMDKAQQPSSFQQLEKVCSLP